MPNKYLTWPIDDRNTLELKQSFLGKQRILVNGREIPYEKTGKGKRTLSFKLEDNREAEITIAPYGILRVDRELRVQGEPVLSQVQLSRIACAQCGSKFKAGDKFCEKCGATLPSPANRLRMARLREAGAAIGYLSAMFLFFGIVMFFVQQGTADKALDNLAKFSDGERVKLTDGKEYIVRELRDEIRMEPVTVLLTNIILSIIMFGLYFYSKKAPLVAIIAAAAIYGSVIVANAAIDPKTIGQGIIVKIIVIGLFIRGIRMALELRKAEA